MSGEQDRIEVARRMLEWFNVRDTASAQAHATDDVEVVPLRAALEETSYRGPEAFAAFMADIEQTWEELRFDAEALHPAGDRVLAVGQLSTRARVTGADTSARLALLFEFSGDRVSRLRTYSDVEEALEVVGLRD